MVAMPAPTPVPAKDATRRHAPGRSWYDFAARLLPPPDRAGRWVDLGCGAGELLERAAAQGLAGWGLDRVEASAARVLADGRAALVADLERPLPFRDGALDGVALIEAIEHVARAEALVDELRRVLRPGGWLLLTTPNVAHWNYRVRALTGHPPKQEGYHLRFFTRATLARLLGERGFRPDGDASYGRVPLLSRLAAAGRGRGRPFVVWPPLQPLLAKHFVWRLVADDRDAGAR